MSTGSRAVVGAAQGRPARRFPRVAVSWHAQVQVPGFRATRVTCVDLSQQGAGLSGGAAMLPVGTTVYLRVSLGAEEDGEVIALGQIVHRDPEGDRAGMRFVSVAIDSVQRLYRFVHGQIRRQPPPPLERVRPGLWRRLLGSREDPTPAALAEAIAVEEGVRQVGRRDRRRRRLGALGLA